MIRLYPKLIFYSLACHYFIVFGECETSIASNSEQIKEPVKLEKKVIKQNSVAKTTTKNSNKKQSSNNFQLVPPPPPQQPSFLDWSNITGLSPSLDLYNKEELEQKLEQIKPQIVNAKSNVDENDSQLTEAKDKAQRFNSLYTEGVISRKELNTAQKNILDKEHSLDEAKGKLIDLQLQEKAILRRMGIFKKNRVSAQHTDKSKK